MKVRLLVLFLSLFVCAFSVAAQTVIEDESSAVINQKTADISLMIQSKSASLDIPISLTLVDPTGGVRSSFSQTARIGAGKKSYKFHVPLGEIVENARDEIVWWRVTYRVGSANGVVSLSEML